MRVPIFSIALNTFRESIRAKVLYSILFFAILLIAVSAFFGTVTIGDQVKVIKDFGLFSLSLFTVAYAILSGSALLNKELSRRTIYNILSRPVRRWQFLVGKYLGLVATSGTILLLMAIGFSLFVFCFEQKPDPLLPLAYLHILLELCIVCAATIFFSSIVVTPMLAGLFSLGVFLAGRSADFLLYFLEDGTLTGVAAWVMKGIYALLPKLGLLNISDLVVWGSSPSAGQMAWSLAYAVMYSGTLLVLAALAFERRQFN